MTHLFYQDRLHATTDEIEISSLLRRGWAITVPPSYDASTQAAPVWQSGAWMVRDLTMEEVAKVWPDVEHFIAEFTMEELAGIGLSMHPTIAALRVLMSTWLSTVRSDDDRVILGLNALESEQILTSERRSVITSL